MTKGHCLIVGFLVGAGALYVYQKSTGKMVPR